MVNAESKVLTEIEPLVDLIVIVSPLLQTLFKRFYYGEAIKIVPTTLLIGCS